MCPIENARWGVYRSQCVVRFASNNTLFLQANGDDTSCMAISVMHVCRHRQRHVCSRRRHGTPPPPLSSRLFSVIVMGRAGMAMPEFPRSGFDVLRDPRSFSISDPRSCSRRPTRHLTLTRPSVLLARVAPFLLFRCLSRPLMCGVRVRLRGEHKGLGHTNRSHIVREGQSRS